jgi:hypothetical protein
MQEVARHAKLNDRAVADAWGGPRIPDRNASTRVTDLVEVPGHGLFRLGDRQLHQDGMVQLLAVTVAPLHAK